MKDKKKFYSTSIGELFRFELIVIKFCGGSLFDAPISCYLATLYKLVFMLLLLWMLSSNTPVYKRIIMESKAAEENTKVFVMLKFIIFWSMIAASFIGSISTRKFIQIIIHKRIKVNNQSFSSDLAHADPLPNPFTLRRKQSTHSRFMPRISSMQSARIYIYTYCILTTLIVIFLEKYERHYRSTHMTNESLSAKTLIHCTSDDTKTTDYFTLSNATDRDSNHVDNFGSVIQLYIRHLSDITISLTGSLIDMLTLYPEDLKKLFVVSAGGFFVYGRMVIALLITTFMSDLLRAMRLQLGNNRMPTGSRSSLEIEEQMECATHILIQIRDVSLTLRSMIRNEYLLVCMSSRAGQMEAFSYLIAFIACRQYIWVALRLVDLILLYAGMFVARIGFIWMHAEAREFSVFCERQLINATKQRHSNPESSRRYYWALINYRLAAEIEEIWPTDWLKPDVVSFLSDLLNSFIFAAGIYQLIDARIQLESLRPEQT